MRRKIFRPTNKKHRKSSELYNEWIQIKGELTPGNCRNLLERSFRFLANKRGVQKMPQFYNMDTEVWNVCSNTIFETKLTLHAYLSNCFLRFLKQGSFKNVNMASGQQIILTIMARIIMVYKIQIIS